MKAVTMSRSTSWRFTSDLMGRDVSLLANLRISSTERNNSSPCFGEILAWEEFAAASAPLFCGDGDDFEVPAGGDVDCARTTDTHALAIRHNRQIRASQPPVRDAVTGWNLKLEAYTLCEERIGLSAIYRRGTAHPSSIPLATSNTVRNPFAHFTRSHRPANVLSGFLFA